MKNNYEQQIKRAAEKFLEFNQESMIQQFGLQSDSKVIRIAFFGIEYWISRSTGLITRAADSSEAGFNEAMAIYDLLCCSKEGAELTGEWIVLNSLHPHVAITHSSSLLAGTSREFAGRTSELRAACERLGGLPMAKSDAGYYFSAFDCLPMVLQFWDEDDEFPAKTLVLFDTNTLDFIHYETGWYIAEHLLRLIKAEMKAGNT